MKTYIFASQRSWGKYVFDKYYGHKENWKFVGSTEELKQLLKKHNPEYIFFVHWSSIVPEDIVEAFECVCFHPSDLPHGRGGTPIQNQIKDGYTETKLTAFRMTKELDGGPIYLQEWLSLENTAEEIYMRMCETAVDMIEWIVYEKIQPQKQEGFITTYKRRKPSQSEIITFNVSNTLTTDINELYDHIRMLDAEGYPKAYLDHNGYRFTFSRPTLRVGKIVCDVEIAEID